MFEPQNTHGNRWKPGESGNPYGPPRKDGLRNAEAHDATIMAKRCGIVPDDWQAELLRSESKQLCLNCSRQSGKSTVSSLLAVHQACYCKNSLVLVASPSLRQSQELFRKIKDAIIKLNPGLIAEESALRVELANGSRIVALPGKESTIRGFSGVDLCILDEASRVDDALYQSMRPMLAVSGGRMILLSTPFGKRGFFYEVWENGDAYWHKVRVTADQCPRIDPAWLETERNSIGEWWFNQEYGCQFVETDDAVFSYDDIEKALDQDLEPLFNQAMYPTESTIYLAA